MRMILLIVTILFSTADLFADETPASYPIEIYLRTRNTDGATITFTASVVYPNATRWSSRGYLTTGMTSAEIEIEGDYSGTSMGFDYDSTQSDNPHLGFATYIITVDAYPYSKTATLTLISDGWYFTGDKWVLYDLSQDKCYLTDDSSMTPISDITNNSLTIYNSSYPSSCHLQPTDPVDLTVTSSGGHPYLSWTESEPAEGTKYKVYRNNTLIYTTSVGQSNWTDEEVNIQSGLSNISYKVRAYCADDTRSKSSNNYTNTVVTGGTYEGADKQISIIQLVPQSTAIQGIYPNPFNPDTKIRYSISKPLDTKISVYNVLGDKKQILVNERKNPGQYEASFNGKDLPSGTYFVILQSGNTIETRKIMLLK